VVISRGTGSSNPSPSSGESGANSTPRFAQPSWPVQRSQPAVRRLAVDRVRADTAGKPDHRGQGDPPAAALQNEGTLIDAMQNAWRFVDNEVLRERLKEARGIGTPATRAEIQIRAIPGEHARRRRRTGAVARAAEMIGGDFAAARNPGTNGAAIGI
jgi:hypothetical protein